MKKIFCIVFLFLFALTSCSDEKLSVLEQQYIDELHQWIKTGNQNTVRSIVQTNCSKLTM